MKPLTTLLEFATTKELTKLLIKERAKCRRRNRSDKHHSHDDLNKECDLDELGNRKKLSRIMPPRRNWVRPKKNKRKTLANGANDTCKNAEKALWLTIERDRKLQGQGKEYPSYLDELDAFIKRIRAHLASGTLVFEKPQLTPILKSTKHQPDGTILVTCRPLSVYNKLVDKIILAVVSRYLTKFFDRYLHPNILSYRRARRFSDYEKHHVTDFNDGIKLIMKFRENHLRHTIYAADCDIKKFYDIIPHTIIRDCFLRLLDRTPLTDDGKEQVMRLLEAYLKSYNFYEDAWQNAEQNDNVYNKICRRLHDDKRKNHYQLGWVDELLNDPEKRQGRGVPQGGSLSLLIANIVLNDVDQPIVKEDDPNRLFIRYCDDMILLHTNPDECRRFIDLYTQSLEEHGLYYHPFKPFDRATNPAHDFWKAKSHQPFLWGEGDGSSNRYIGFLGYELRRDGKLRLRKDNVMRFKEKFHRLYYALRRYKKKHTEEMFAEHQKQTLEKSLSMAFYTAFDQETFRKGSQYRYMTKLKERIVKRLAKQKSNGSK